MAITVDGVAPAAVGDFLDVDWNVGVRTGLHCAPLMHEALGTAPHGAVRFGFGPFNTAGHVDRALAGLAAIAARA